MTRSRRAVIVGAGIGGLAAGVALQRAGWRVRIYERAASPRELGFGLLLAPNAMAALGELGLADTIARNAAQVSGDTELRRLDGRVTRRFHVQLGGPAVVALRQDLHGALLARVGEPTLCPGEEAVGFRQDDRGVALELKSGQTEPADVLIGADGVGSVIRKTLHPHEPPARASGYCALRGVAYGVAGHLGALTAVGYLDDGLEVATTRAGRDAVYWYVSLLAGDVPAGSRAASDVLRGLLPAFEPPLRAIIEATAPADMRFDELYRRDPLPVWGRGRVTLLGDAAHPVLPHTGQGAAQALEDAVALGLALGRAGDLDTALRRYEDVRMRRTRRFVALGPRIARVTTTHSIWIRAIRTGLIRLIPEWLVSGSMRPGDPHHVLRMEAP